MALMLTGEDIPIYEVIIIVATTRIESQLGTGNVIWAMHLPSSFFTPLQREKKKKSQGKHSSGDRQSPVSQSRHYFLLQTTTCSGAQTNKFRM